MKTYQNGATLGRIAAKRRSEQWSKIFEENHQKLAFGEGVQSCDLASFSRRIKSYRFIMESSKSKPYSASSGIQACWQAGGGSQHLLGPELLHAKTIV